MRGKKLGYKTIHSIRTFYKIQRWGKKQAKILMEVIICLKAYGQFFKVFILNCNFQLLYKSIAAD